MTTPESKVKTKVKALLDKYDVYYFMPVQTGIGAAGLDFHAVIYADNRPIAFFIETKRQGAEPTDRQEYLIKRLTHRYRCNVFVIDGPFGLKQLQEWLEQVTK